MAKDKTHLIVFQPEGETELQAMWGTGATYEEIVQTHTVVVARSLFGVVLSGVDYVAFCDITRDHDFTLKGPREVERS